MSATGQKTYTTSYLTGAPVIGMLLPAIKSPLTFMMDIAEHHGDIIAFKVMGIKTIQLNHPDLIHYVLVENHKNYKKSKPYIRFESAIGLALLTSNGDKWRRDRQRIQPLFNRSLIMQYHFEIVSEVGEKYKRRWLELTKDGPAEINITQEMAKITTEVILKASFGRAMGDEMVSTLNHSYNIMMDYLKYIRVIPQVDLRKLFCTPAYFKFKREVDKVDAIIKQLSDHHRSGQTSDNRSMLALLIEGQKTDPDHFTDKDIRDHCVGMVFAGFESTSILMQWLWYELDYHPDEAQKLRENITTHAPCTATIDSASLTYEQVAQMDYLTAALKEAMRMYPSFWMTGREPIEDDYFGDYKVDKGAMIALPLAAIHRHPKWWKHPNHFMPDRFLHGNEEKIPDGAYFPFSLGPRKCVGHAFAMMEASTVIAKLLPLFNVRATNKLGNSVEPSVSIKLKYPLMAEISRV